MAWLKPMVMCSLHRDTPWAPGSGGWGDCVSGPHRTETMRETVLGRLPHPGHSSDSQVKYIPNFAYEKGPFTCQGASPWEADFRFTTCLEVTAHWFLPETSLYTHLEPQFFATIPKGTLPNCQVWWSAGVTVVPQDCIYLPTLNAAV